MRKKQYPFFLLIIIFSTVLQFCKPKDAVPPGFPPKESLSVDISFFDQTAPVGSYYEFAQYGINNWSDYINDSLDFYRQFYDLIVEKNLEFQTGKTWLVQFEENFGLDTNYEVDYFEIVEADTINSKLFISYERYNPLTDLDSLSVVLLMDGSMTNLEYGHWTINKIDTGFSNTFKFLSIDWYLQDNKNPEIKFTNLLIGGDNGNYLFYKDSIADNFTSYLSLYYKADDRTTVIQWNSSSMFGRVKDFNYFGNEDWHCWDENLSDMICN